MNAPALPASDAGHLDGPLLEALAAGAAREEEQALARRHLDACARCRGDLEALRAENAAFGDFFAAEEARLAGRSPVRRRERAYRFTAFAAAGLAAMLALALIWEKFAPGGSAATTPQRQVAEEGKTTAEVPTPAPVTPPEVPPQVPAPKTDSTPPRDGQAVTYQGRTADDWAADLTATDENTRNAAKHALEVMGADILPTLIKLVREGTTYQKEFASKLLSSFDDPKSTQPLLSFLADPDWRVRLAAVRGLQGAAKKDPAVAEALRLRKQDRDKAVVEAVNEILGELEKAQAARDAVFSNRMKIAVELFRAGKFAEALALVEEMKAMPDLSPEERRDVEDTLATFKIQVNKAESRFQDAQAHAKAGRWTEAAEGAAEALARTPGDARIRQFLDMAKARLAKGDLVRARMESARAALEQKRWTEAIVLCKDGLASSPNDPALMELLAHAEAALKQETETKRKRQVGETDLPGTGGTAR